MVSNDVSTFGERLDKNEKTKEKTHERINFAMENIL